MAKKKWYDYFWITSSLYIALGFMNILFAWLGLLCFMIPLLISIIKGTKGYCNDYCGRGQLFTLLGAKLSLNNKMPVFLYSKWFRYGFLAFFMTMFGNMLFSTYLVFSGVNSLAETITLFWSFKLPWQWAYADGIVTPWIAQFAFGFYSLMLTSTLIGIIFMVFFRPRSWCVICPMGTMTQLICKLKYDD
ncbi:4Fe-4S binding protein [Synergistaceae bacterium OttesenSCG-928-D05]|nr:4Fe-4S binding protein [Synergistaceae bacterium OttesenSCG-928-D05]